MAEFGDLIFQKGCHALDLLHCLGVAVWVMEARGSQKGQILFNVRQLLVQILATFVAVLLKCLCSQTATWKSMFNIGCLRFNVQCVKQHPLTVSLFVMVTPRVKNQHEDSPKNLRKFCKLTSIHCCHTCVGVVHFFCSALRWVYILMSICARLNLKICLESTCVALNGLDLIFKTHTCQNKACAPQA